jgi:hypothetical protein
MTEAIPPFNRPPIGFIVEGDGEYNCYPSLVHRIVNSSNFLVPRLNAGGCGKIFRSLQELLTNLVITSHPFHILITVDLKDGLGKYQYNSCRDLKVDLESQVNKWKAINAVNDSRLQPLPEHVTVVIQIKKFESWIIGDVSNLVKAGYLKPETVHVSNVDESVLEPAHWLQDHLKVRQNLKDPVFAKNLVSRLDIGIVRSNSYSFDKFVREVSWSYEQWCYRCGII